MRAAARGRVLTAEQKAQRAERAKIRAAEARRRALNLRHEEICEAESSVEEEREEREEHRNNQGNLRSYSFTTSINYQRLLQLSRDEATKKVRRKWKQLSEDWKKMGYQDFSKHLQNVLYLPLLFLTFLKFATAPDIDVWAIIKDYPKLIENLNAQQLLCSVDVSSPFQVEFIVYLFIDVNRFFLKELVLECLSPITSQVQRSPPLTTCLAPVLMQLYVLFQIFWLTPYRVESLRRRDIFKMALFKISLC